MYQRYEMAVHKKERDRDQARRFVCSSPVYDSNDPASNSSRIQRPAAYNFEGVDEGREFKDEGIYPGLGSFHFYHRIDGKLVAMGVVDITKTVLNSQYFIYDPDYSFLCMGVVGAIHEIEFMKMVQRLHSPNFNMYQLGELVLDCPKVNYKLNYKPGLLICPRTKEIVKFDDVKDKVRAYTKMPIKYKREKLLHCQLAERPPDYMSQNELMAETLREDVGQLPFLYENTRMLRIDDLQQAGKDHVKPIVLQLIQHLGFEFVQNSVLELKFEKQQEKKEETEQKETEKKEEEPQKPQGDGD